MNQPFSSAAETRVTCEVVVRVVVAGEPQVSLPASFHYHRADPYAVRLAIGTKCSGTVDWVFARDLLWEGMSRPVGEGAVLVSPRSSARGPVVRIIVRSPAGSAMFDIRTAAVADFLHRAHRLVPPGTEGSHTDIDHLVTLLSGTGE
ncbi:SsgA family sporulation/cell division regulator [Actinacidiphila rubida]|uniref:Streptomyces sporulation and cell division protein, SsgA n=1 Tax=Actinacidiphila rubida TaxID=310780 RepID=A0A1H8K907_9ACTN|nr:SsgA family sporulation/cell division regulator [Actinacidiphila rubida]SEN88898.1 Streptomyces sporulation and cell division protein, SsgA [Actinacidiphila rubida]